jgi:hypothetical protein
LKKDISQTEQSPEEKKKKLETIEELEKLRKLKDSEKEKGESSSQIKIKELEQQHTTYAKKIERLSKETESTKKLIRNNIREIERSNADGIELTDLSMEILRDSLDKSNKKRDYLEKTKADMIYERERVSYLLGEMKKEEEFILKERFQLEEEKKKVREQSQRYLLEKSQMERTIKRLQAREDNQKKRTQKKTNRVPRQPIEETSAPINYSRSTEKTSISQPKKHKKPTEEKKKQFTRKKPRREKKESFLENLMPNFLKSE